MKKKTVILTGSGGWLGKATINILKDRVNLICLSRNKKFLETFNGNCYFWDGSQYLDKLLGERIYSSSIILHTASFPYSEYRKNQAILNLFDVLKNDVALFDKLICKNSPLGFILVSSPTIYSIKDYFISANTKKICKPANKYGISKFIIEQQLINLATSSNIPFSIIRPHNICSLDEKPSDGEGHLYSDIIYKILIAKQNNLDITLPPDYKMSLMPESHYTNTLRVEIDSISDGQHIELKNKLQINLCNFVDLVVKYGQSKHIIDRTPSINYSTSIKKNKKNILPEDLYTYCSCSPTEIILEYLTKHFS